MFSSSKAKKGLPMSSPISSERLLSSESTSSLTSAPISMEKLMQEKPTLDLDLEVSDEPPKNKVGEFMRRSLIDPRKYYCGLEVDPDPYGPGRPFICDPEQGHQCHDCKKAQRFIEKTDTSQPVNEEGRTMKRGHRHRHLFYCGFKGCGPSKGPQCEACEKTQDQICMVIAQEQHKHDSTPKVQMQQRSLTATDQDSTTCCTCCTCCLCFARLECALCKCITRAQQFCCYWCCRAQQFCCYWCCRCCVDLDWYLCKCCVQLQMLCCKCCCRAEIGCLECYFQSLLASAKLCCKAPSFACFLFAALEIIFIWATFRLPTTLQSMIGDEGYVWGFILVIFIICCLIPCCALCAPCAIVVHEVRTVQKKVESLESSIESLAESGLGLADRINTLQDMFARSFIGQMMGGKK